MGSPEYKCGFCGAFFWYRERCVATSTKTDVRYNLCCREGRVCLPALQPPPQLLKMLLSPNACPDSNHFRDLIRTYNSLLSMTSIGCHVDEHINNGSAPYVFKISGEVYHRIGSLLPVADCRPSFLQLYVFDTENEINNRLAPFSNAKSNRMLRASLIEALVKMLDTHNVLVRHFRCLRDRYLQSNLCELQIRIRSDRDHSAHQYSAPTASEIVGFVVGDLSAEQKGRDIIVEHRSQGFKRVSAEHPSLMALQYPLTFPYGEDGYHPHISYAFDTPGGKKTDRKFVTMSEYYAYRLHPRFNEATTIFEGGRLFQQILVNWYACVQQDRLNFIERNQSILRCDKLCNIRNAVLEGDMFGSEVGKRIVLPASHVGSPRYMYQNYHDAIALCRHFGPPDLFITFTCNPQWAEIGRLLLNGQRAHDRADVVARVFKMKSDELLLDIRQRNCLGMAVAGNLFITLPSSVFLFP